MDSSEGERNSNMDLCKFCNERKRMYTCPRCEMGYCNADCYKSEAHSECSESFYKQCVEEELKSQELDPEAQRRMIDILKRVHEHDINDGILDTLDGSDQEGSALDSDDENDIPDLETRLQNVDLDNADEIWSALTDSEKQEFDSLIKNGEVEKLLPEWVPWWTYSEKKKLVQELETIEESDSCTKHCPAVIDVPVYNAIQKASPTVKYNLLNVIYAYAYTALYYNGDYMSCAEDATIDFLSICENIRSNKVYEDAATAFQSVIENIRNREWLPKDEQIMLALKDAGDQITQGPDDINKSRYICAAISELHRLFAKSQVSKLKKTSKEFRNKFARRSDTLDLNLSKKSLLLSCKKLEYYISWARVNHT